MSNECSHCDSRTSCSKGCAGIKLFGVQINVADDGAAAESSLRKTKSFDNLEACIGDNTAVEAAGYLSDGLVHQSSKSRKKGKPWSEEEHRSFLLGLEKRGKGDWKGIANDFVLSRNSSQVASHAQKYFIRKGGIEKKRRRASVFDIPLTDQLDKSSEVTIQGSQSPESSQTASSSAKINNNEQKGQASMPASERPPPVPIRRRGSIPDFRSTDHSPRLIPRLTRGFPPRPPPPPLAWLPVVNFSGEIRGFLPNNIHGDLATYPTFLRPTLCQQQGSSSHAGSSAAAAAPAAKNDELNLSISNLTLNH